MNDWNKQIIAEFRANGGKVAQFGDAPMVILHTIGAKTGEPREIPLVAKVDHDNMIIFASKAGATTNPDWYHNLVATPEIDVEFRAEKFRARLDQLSAEDASSAIQAQAHLMPAFGDYVKSAAPRQIPAFAIRRI